MVSLTLQTWVWANCGRHRGAWRAAGRGVANSRARLGDRENNWVPRHSLGGCGKWKKLSSCPRKPWRALESFPKRFLSGSLRPGRGQRFCWRSLSASPHFSLRLASAYSVPQPTPPPRPFKRGFAKGAGVGCLSPTHSWSLPTSSEPHLEALICYLLEAHVFANWCFSAFSLKKIKRAASPQCCIFHLPFSLSHSPSIPHPSMHLCTHVRVYLRLCIFHEAALSRSVAVCDSWRYYIFCVHLRIFILWADLGLLAVTCLFTYRCVLTRPGCCGPTISSNNICSAAGTAWFVFVCSSLWWELIRGQNDFALEGSWVTCIPAWSDGVSGEPVRCNWLSKSRLWSADFQLESKQMGNSRSNIWRQLTLRGAHFWEPASRLTFIQQPLRTPALGKDFGDGET